MEIIKKKILQAVITGTTAVTCTFRDPKTGKSFSGTCTCSIIIPNTGVTYNFKILLQHDVEGIGFLDAYLANDSYTYISLSGVISGQTEHNIKMFESYLSGGTTLSGFSFSASSGIISGTTNDANYSGYTYAPYIVTGESSSRLSELRKYTVSSAFTDQYFSGGTYTVDGVDYYVSNTGTSITYYLGGIKYVDQLTGSTSGTTFRFTGLGITSPNFINVPIYKDPNKENIISNPKISNDVFIIRQELSAFENNYRLEHVKNLIDLETYAGGKYFNIVNNS
jgi:hypothetical protein